MPLDAATKNQLSQFGRTISLLFNRSMMYQRRSVRGTVH